MDFETVAAAAEKNRFPVSGQSSSNDLLNNQNQGNNDSALLSAPTPIVRQVSISQNKYQPTLGKPHLWPRELSTSNIETKVNKTQVQTNSNPGLPPKASSVGFPHSHHKPQPSLPQPINVPNPQFNRPPQAQKPQNIQRQAAPSQPYVHIQRATPYQPNSISNLPNPKLLPPSVDNRQYQSKPLQQPQQPIFNAQRSLQSLPQQRELPNAGNFVRQAQSSIELPISSNPLPISNEPGRQPQMIASKINSLNTTSTENQNYGQRVQPVNIDYYNQQNSGFVPHFTGQNQRTISNLSIDSSLSNSDTIIDGGYNLASIDSTTSLFAGIPGPNAGHQNFVRQDSNSSVAYSQTPGPLSRVDSAWSQHEIPLQQANSSASLLSNKPRRARRAVQNINDLPAVAPELYQNAYLGGVFEDYFKAPTPAQNKETLFKPNTESVVWDSQASLYHGDEESYKWNIANNNVEDNGLDNKTKLNGGIFGLYNNDRGTILGEEDKPISRSSSPLNKIQNLTSSVTSKLGSYAGTILDTLNDSQWSE